MPTYEYYCRRCGTTTEAQYPINDKPARIRCTCGGKAESAISKVNFSISEGGDPVVNKLAHSDKRYSDETSEDRDIERSIPNVDSDDLYKD